MPTAISVRFRAHRPLTWIVHVSQFFFGVMSCINAVVGPCFVSRLDSRNGSTWQHVKHMPWKDSGSLPQSADLVKTHRTKSTRTDVGVLAGSGD